MTKKPYSSLSDAVGTVNRSIANDVVLVIAQERYPSLHLVGLSAGRRGRYRDTVISDTMKPSFVSSAWIRGAPQPS